MKLPITNRLITVSDMVKKADILCDIGCDHGYLPIKLLLEGKISFAYGCDINEGPLKAARKNFDRFSLTDKVELRISDGLKGLTDVEFDVVTICGMGGRLISKILYEGIINRETGKNQIILQPMTEAVLLREFLYKNGFYIVTEELAREDTRFYNIIEISKGKGQEISLLDMYTGLSFINRNNRYLDEYLEKQNKKFAKIYQLKKDYEDVNQLKKTIFELNNYIKK